MVFILGPDALAATLATGLDPLYMIYGEEALLSIEAADMIRKSAHAAGYCEREVFTVESDFNWAALPQAMCTGSLFSVFKIIELRISNAKLGVGGAEMLSWLAANPPINTVTIVLFAKLDRQQQQSKWFRLLSAAAKVIYAKEVSRQQLPAWVAQRLKLQAQSLSASAMAFFVDCVEGNLLAASQEISKLALLYPAGQLELSQLHEAVASSARFDLFRLSESWLAGQSARAARLLAGLAAEGAVPTLILWSFTEDIRMLLRVAKGLRQRRPFRELAAELRIWGGKQQLVQPALQRIGRRRLIEALALCARIDQQIKGAASGDAWHSLVVLGARLAA